ncbi:MAG: LuxR family transcriptional regulator, partial [Myxococcales bacterium]|nr:LuxR family transcriptional regulator [Myxococcales bacterium]
MQHEELPTMESTDGGRGPTRLAAALLALVAALAAVDVAFDLAEGTDARHLAVELAIIALGAVGAALLGRRLRVMAAAVDDAARTSDALRARLAESRAEAERWRAEAQELIGGLGAALDRQFDRWQLTPAEAEVALLMFKGLSHKQIAEVRGVGEATVRQQGRAIYKKAGVTGKHELLAFFLEDLMLPRADG